MKKFIIGFLSTVGAVSIIYNVRELTKLRTEEELDKLANTLGIDLISYLEEVEYNQRTYLHMLLYNIKRLSKPTDEELEGEYLL